MVVLNDYLDMLNNKLIPAASEDNNAEAEVFYTEMTADINRVKSYFPTDQA